MTPIIKQLEDLLPTGQVGEGQTDYQVAFLDGQNVYKDEIKAWLPKMLEVIRAEIDELPSATRSECEDESTIVRYDILTLLTPKE